MDKLENCLKKSRIPEQYYSIGQYAEEEVCIERKGRNWILYEGEKGKKHNVKQYNNWHKAYSDFFSRIAEGDGQEQELCRMMKSNRRMHAVGLPSKEIRLMVDCIVKDKPIIMKQNGKKSIKKVCYKNLLK